MADSTPWFMGVDGATHDAETARLLAYAGTGGQSGVIGVGDMKITQTPTPSAAIRYSAGGVALVNRYPGGEGQSYIGRKAVPGVIPIAPQGSGSARSELIIARVRDPQYQTVSGFNPSLPNEFDYFTIESIPAAGPHIRNYTPAWPCTVLARIDIPANTAVITNAMITDLRDKINSRRQRHVKVVAPSGDLNATTTYRHWPYTTTPDIISIPQWATYAVMTVHMSGVQLNGPVVVGTRGVLGNLIDSNNGILSYPGTLQNTRQSYTHGSRFVIPPSYRGADVGYALQAQRTSAGGLAQLDYQTTIVYDIEFQEEPE